MKKIKAICNLFFRSKTLSSWALKANLLQLYNFTVNSGPFKEMKYINKSSGSVLVPKIVGTYECELHDVIEKLCNKEYELLIDIGCAEGYYAVGLAFRNRHKPSFKVYAYDTNPEALSNLTALSKINDLGNKIIGRELFIPSELEQFDGKQGLIICDIEGAEKDLINPGMYPNFLKFDFLIEIHDGEDSNEIKNYLTTEFKTTHHITLIKYDKNHEKRRDAVKWIRNREGINAVLDEGRKYGLEWFYLEKQK